MKDNKIPQEIEEIKEMYNCCSEYGCDETKNDAIETAYKRGFKAGQEQSKGKLTLNHKCPLCNKNIFLGDDIVIQKRIVYHLNCYDREKTR